MSAVLDVQGLDVRIPLASGMLRPVRDVSFSVKRGETLGIVGESGCGKSLTSMAIMNLLPPRAVRSAARLDFDGIDLTRVSERDMSDIRGDRMAMIFQEPMTSLNPAFTIGNQLEEAFLRHRRVKRAVARERAVYLLEIVGIAKAGERLGQYPHQLSGGLRQRVMIAMALMCGPKLIIADEPTTALDVTIQAEILHLLAQLKREFDMALVLITHDLGVVARVADRVAVMYAGQIAEAGSVEDVFLRPQHPYTQGLLRCIPIPGRTKPGERLGSIPGLVPNLIGEMRGCSFGNRCAHALTACSAADIALEPAEAQHFARCILPSTTPMMMAEAVGV
jgi:peptide/nickel transport system ATP-binding protein